MFTNSKGNNYFSTLLYFKMILNQKKCPENENAIIEMSIFDKNSTLLFTNADKNYVNQ
jgi:hypothetical protein